VSLVLASAILVHGALAQAVDRLLTARGFSGAVIVERHDEVVLERGYGWADRDRKVPFTTTTIAQIGSLTKQFTAAAIVELAEEKKLDLSDPISKYLAAVPTQSAGITIEQLLTHTSGLVSDCGEDFDRVTKRDLVHRCLTKLRNPPGTQFFYSDLGYSVLAAIVESVTGRSYDDVVRERFLEPLHMRRTGTFFNAPLRPQQALGYKDSSAIPPISERLAKLGGDDWDLKGNGGMEASSLDMYAWFRALAYPSPIPAPVRQKLWTPHARRDSEVEYGYGWFIRRNAAGEIEQVSHTGSDGVFYAAIVWRPKERVFFYLVTNCGEQQGATAASDVLKTVKSLGGFDKIPAQ